MRKIAGFLAVLTLGSTAMAQFPLFDAVINRNANSIVFFDTGSNTISTLVTQQGAAQSTRGIMVARQFVYQSEWTTNGIGAYDLQLQGWDANKSSADPTNLISGAPYQPAPNWESVGTFGIRCIDGNPTPGTLSAGTRNWFDIDYNTTPPTSTVAGVFVNTLVPMSDCWPNPNGGGELVVGFASSDLSVSVHQWDRNNPLSTVTITPAIAGPGTLPLPSAYDAALGDGTTLWVMCYNPLSNPPVNVLCNIDLANGTATTIAVPGLPSSAAVAAPYVGFWTEPDRLPGQLGYVASVVDYNIYQLDLNLNPPVVTSLATIPGTIAGDINSARHVDEYQLVTWWTRNATDGARTFEATYRNASPGDLSVCVPTLLGRSPNQVNLGGFELYLSLDTVSFAALGGNLPGWETTKLIQPGGVATHNWKGLGQTISQLANRDIYATVICARVNTGGVQDLTNTVAPRF